MVKPSLTIKQKIILSFALIGLLLIAASSFFYFSLRGINVANTNITRIAVPVQNQSNALRIDLLNMVKVGAVAFTQTEQSQLRQSEQAFTQLANRFQDQNSALASLIANQPQMQAALNKAAKDFVQFQTASNKMLAAKLAVARDKSQLKSTLKQLDEAKYQASTAMLDLETLDVPERLTNQLDAMVGTGTRIDDMVFNLGPTIESIARLEDLETLNTHQEDTRFLLSNIQNNLDYLAQQAQSFDSVPMVADFKNQYQILVAALDEPGTAYNLQRGVITNLQSAAQQQSAASAAFNSSYEALSQLVNLADAQFDQLQNATSEQIQAGSSIAIVLALIIIVLASVIATFTTKAMIGPLRAVNRLLASFAAGDLSKRLTKRSDDEFGTLIGNMNQLGDDLTALLNAVRDNALTLNQSADTTNEQGERIASAAQDQIGRIQNATDLAEQVLNSSSSVNEEASLTANHVEEATKRSHEVRTIAVTNNERIMSLNDSLQDSVSIMAKLTEHSQSIGTILDTIGSIAEQTNLLALNAAIEAARAGEFGRGFSVVADEVRSLASRTQASTAEIQSMITALQHETHAAEAAIARGQKQAHECAAQSDELTNAIQHIESALDTINEMSQHINHAAEQQLTYTQEIQHTMAQTAETASSNASEAGSLATQSGQVKSLATSLTQSMARFKL